MKKLVIVAIASFITASAFSQGTVLFNNRTGGASAPIINANTGLAAGPAGFLAQLYYGTAGTVDDSTLVSVANAPATFVQAGYVIQTSARVLNNGLTIAGGADAAIQVRAWEAALGADWDTALANWNSGGAYAGMVMGKSSIFNQKTGDASNPTVPPTTLVNMASFTMVPVPEPSVIALGALGLAALLYRRRK
jgi:hypothetical protein